jgi:hypothetical protein
MQPSPLTPPRSLTFLLHAALWSSAGLASALYLGWTMWGPPAPETIALKGDRGLGMQNTLVQISGDVRTINAKLMASEDATHALLGRVTALEEKSAFVSTAAQASPPAAVVRPEPAAAAVRPADVRPQAATAVPRSSEITTGAILKRVVASPPPIQPTPPSAVLTPTVALPAAVVPAAPAEPTRPMLGIQLSTAPNLDALRLNWSLLNEKHREVLGPLQTRYRQTPGKPNAPFQLIAGPVRSQAEAARICKALAGSGVTCRATTYSGEEL